MPDILDRLKSEVEHPEAWIPEPGETITGEVLRWEAVTIERDGEDSRTCDVLTLRTEDESERSVWTWHTVLRNELVGKIEPGDFVAIHYRGRKQKQKQKGDGDFASYRVAIEKGTGTPDFIAAGAQAEGDIPF